MAQTSVLNGEQKSSTPARPAGPLPDWYPAWATELADLYFSGTTSVFVLHGNVHDLVRLPDGDEHTLLQPERVSGHARCSAAGTSCSATI